MLYGEVMLGSLKNNQMFVQFLLVDKVILNEKFLHKRQLELMYVLQV